MNFFQQQDEARANTKKLIFFFVLAVIAIIVITTFVVAASLWGVSLNTGAVSLNSHFIDHLNWPLLLKTALGVILLVGCIIVYKRLQLGHGGYTIAERLGGKPVYSDTTNPDERQLLNVVEEMAIAAGMPVPPVYVLDETTINAFAAGYSEADAVIGITKGALQRLTRDQLQGVIAHEFSHILHGDMRLNLNLIAVLSGIVFIGQAGRFVFHGLGTARRSSKQGSGIIAVAGLGTLLIIIGAIGTLFGKLIKSAVSRQREFLADASAVQYTRNPDGIADALKVIGSGVGTGVRSHKVEEYSHMFFGDVIYLRSFNFFATHPPLDERISRIDHYWDGQYLPGKPLKTKEEEEKQKQDHADAYANLPDFLKNIGSLDPVIVALASTLIETLPVPLHQAALHPAQATALMLAMRLDTNKAIQDQQLSYLTDTHAMRAEVARLKPLVDKLHPTEILPLIEISIPALKRQSAKQYEKLKWLMTQFIMADKVSDYKEWLHFRLLSHYLDPQFALKADKSRKRRSYNGLYQVDNECIIVLSLLANVSHETDEERDQAFDHGLQVLAIKVDTRLKQDKLDLQQVNKALAKLELLVPLLKEEFLSACARCIEYDNQVTVMAWDLLRVISACLGAPMPLVNRPPRPAQKNTSYLKSV